MIRQLVDRLRWSRVMAYWTFAVVAGFFLAHLESVQDIEPTFSILAFIYFALLIFWGVKWLAGQVGMVFRQRKEKINIELKHLQSQISPHFFFNTLNNLYGLVEKDSKKAQSMILKLSDMMRYSIYDGQKEWVTLEEEIAYLKNYIALHRMRYHKEIDVRFDINIEDESVNVLPLMFITLLENAFKHGVENLRNGAFVHIHFISLDGSVYIKVENNYDPEELNDQPGIGISNLQRRLQLAYPKRHTFTTSSDGDIYTAELKIKAS